ncbi:MAG: FAD binding domain-containing protein [Chloroflexota bacterium]
MWKEYYSVATIEEAVSILVTKRERARIVAGATDLILELERGARKDVDTLIDISRIPGLDLISIDPGGMVHVGPLTTHNHCAQSPELQMNAYPLARAAWEVGAPQIRNRGTVAGNLITASPANDTITPLVALEAQVTLKSARGTRTICLDDFYIGVRKTVLEPDEMLVDIAFPALGKNQKGTFLKWGLRRAQAISVVNVAIILSLSGSRIDRAVIALGSVAPTIIRAYPAEDYLCGKELSSEVIAEAAILASREAQPIDDLRGSADYRGEMVRVLSARGLQSILDGQETAGFPYDPVLLWGTSPTNFLGGFKGAFHTEGSNIETIINGKKYVFENGSGKTLLRLLREDAGLTGTKEGCAEGECGACTVFLDGKAVMACLVPAPRAHQAEIITIEHLSANGNLHPVQEAFISHGAVQCGYCTPGFIMSAVKLLEEKPIPSTEEIAQAITGNLCRCTGYYKIISAIETAVLKQEE